MNGKRFSTTDLETVVKGVADLIAVHVGGDRDSRGEEKAPSPYGFERALRGARRRGLRRRGLVGAICGLVLIGAGFAVRALVVAGAGGADDTYLSYTVDRLPARAADPVALPAAPEAFTFSDGTRIDLAAGARGRVAEVGRRGARFVLDDGKARVRVVHRAGAEWSLVAGPFTITVHGTAFSVEWSAERSWLDMKMESGVVSVSGPLSEGRVVLRAGQSLSVGLRPEPASIPEAARPPEAPGVLAPPHALEHHSASSGAVAARARSATGAPRRWSQDLDEDRAGAIVADAETLGIERVLRESSSQELSALADAARYKHRYALARRALMGQMRRFPASPRARDAAFFLGRLCEDAEDRLEDALGFYSRYLQATPDGTYAAEALGRKMMVLERSARQDEARVIAADYLRRYPKGPYAHAARALARAP